MFLQFSNFLLEYTIYFHNLNVRFPQSTVILFTNRLRYCRREEIALVLSAVKLNALAAFRRYHTLYRSTATPIKPVLRRDVCKKNYFHVRADILKYG